jgi:hypothetical protein
MADQQMESMFLTSILFDHLRVIRPAMHVEGTRVSGTVDLIRHVVASSSLVALRRSPTTPSKGEPFVVLSG